MIEGGHYTRWSKQELEILKEQYQTLGLRKTAKLLPRSEAAVQSKANELGLQTCKSGPRRLLNHQAAKNFLFNSYAKAAKKRGYGFYLLQKEFESLIKKNCFYCGCEPINKYRGYVRDFNFKFNGIDRVDNSLGYEIENCVSCCSTCNNMKKQMTVEQFLSHIRSIYNFSLGE